MNICRICASNLLNSVKLSEFTIIRCSTCGYAQLEPYPSISDVAKIYNATYFKEKAEDDHIQDSAKKYTEIKKYIPNNAVLLDYGCGTGNFLKAAIKDRHNCHGFDISQFAAEKTAQDLNIVVKYGYSDKNTFFPNYFDVITLFDVIEHTTDYENLLGNIQKWLKPGGKLFLTTPDIQSWDARLMGLKWYGYKKYPEHINFFTDTSLRKLLTDKSFRVISSKTWGFVRSIEYIMRHGFGPRWGSELINMLPSKIRQTKLYIPMTDLMIIAEKPINLSQ